MTMGEKIYYLRRQKNMTQEELAKRVGVSYQAINKYEHGRVTNIPIERLERIADALDTTTSYLRSGLVVSSRDPYDEFLDDQEDMTAEEALRRRLCSIINHATGYTLEAYETILNLPSDRIEAIIKLLDAQGGKHRDRTRTF